MVLAFRSAPPNTHTFNKETNNLLCMNWSCKELLKRNLKEESILPESNTFQVRLIYSLGFRHMHLSLCVQWIQLNASLHWRCLAPTTLTKILFFFPIEIFCCSNPFILCIVAPQTPSISWHTMLFLKASGELFIWVHVIAKGTTWHPVSKHTVLCKQWHL